MSGSRVERECQWQAVGILSATERTSGARTLTTMFMFTCRRSSSCRIALRHQHRADEPSSPTAVGYRFTGGRRLPVHRLPSATASLAAVGYRFTGGRRLGGRRLPLHRRPAATASPAAGGSAAVGYRFTGGRRLPLHRRPSATSSPAAVGLPRAASPPSTSTETAAPPPHHRGRERGPLPQQSAPPPLSAPPLPRWCKRAGGIRHPPLFGPVSTPLGRRIRHPPAPPPPA